MGILKKIGSGLHRAVQFVAQLHESPLGSDLENVLIPEGNRGVFEALVNTVVAVERIFFNAFGASAQGVSKALASVPFIREAVLSSEFFYDKEITDKNGFEAAIRMYNDATVLLLNSVDKKAPKQLTLGLGDAKAAKGYTQQGALAVTNAAGG